MTTDLLSADLPTALRQVAALSLVAVGVWAALIGLLASWRPTARLARALTPRMLRAALFTTVSGAASCWPGRMRSGSGPMVARFASYQAADAVATLSGGASAGIVPAAIDQSDSPGLTT